MPNIRVDFGYTVHDGTEIIFRSPVDCSAVTGLIVYYPGADGNATSKVFAFADAHGNNVGDIDHLFAEDVVVKVILDVTKSMAFVQNADTNSYLEGRFNEKAPAGFGYGEVLSIVAGSTEAELETSLTTILNGMANYTTKQVRCLLSFATDSASYVLATVYKHTPAYAAVTFETVGSSTLKKVYSNGWQPLEWENPPLVNGVEYRTTERYNNKPVYLMRVAKAHTNDVGSSTGGAGLFLSHSAEIYRMVRIDGIAHLANDTTVPFNVDSVTKATRNPGLVEGQITLTVNGVWSKPTVTVVMAYIKQ